MKLFRRKSVTTPPESEQPQRFLSANDIGRPALVLLLLLFTILASALTIIYQAYQYRQLFNTQQQLVVQWDELQVEWGQLLLEQSALGANSRVEKIAKAELSMQVPQSQSIEMVSYE
ncbi:MAG: cell division protein FtsL [Pseudomonadales bacterium]